MIRINLLPKELQDKGKGADWVIAGYGLILVLGFFSGINYALGIHNYHELNDKKQVWSKQLAAIKAKVAEVEQLDAQKNQLNAKKEAVEQLFSGRLLYPKFMADFYATIPKDVWVTDLTVSEDGNHNFKISAVSNSVSTDGIADWIQSLGAQNNRFSDISVSAIDARMSSENKTVPESYSFSITLVYQPVLEKL